MISFLIILLESSALIKMSAGGNSDILVRALKGQQVERTPVWLMRQAGRYMADFRKYSDKYPFRQRSETPDIAIELSLQPWRTFGVDGVIMFSGQHRLPYQQSNMIRNKSNNNATIIM